MIDRIVGYKISPLLWKKVRNGLSAGRVQSVATKLVVDREKEIENFISEESWTVDGMFKTSENHVFKLRLASDQNGKINIKNGEEASEILSRLDGALCSVSSIKSGSKKKVPAPPFTTSQLQQEANKKLNFQSKKTMRIAQELYEGISLGKHGEHGLITYMRTDSVRISDDAADAACAFIKEKWGEKYYSKTRRVYKTKSGAQDAHEAIRPSDVTRTPESIKEYLTADQYKLYRLIWCRFVASQMECAHYDTLAVEAKAVTDRDTFIFKNRGESLKFDGFMCVYNISAEDDDNEENIKFPKLSENEPLKLTETIPTQKFSQPPQRYNEATLIKVLEEKGIGRPSTYTPTITTILSREYIERDGKFFRPTNLGRIITEIMSEYFSAIIDYKFTANLETELDQIADGKLEYKKVISDFYEKFAGLLEKAEKEAEKVEAKTTQKELDIICEKCGANMIVKRGRFGQFAACPNYPECKNTKPLDSSGKVVESKQPLRVEGMVCPECGSGIVKRQGRFGEFYACENYPKCKYTKQILQDTGIVCPKCSGKVVLKRAGRRSFYGCDNYPKCDFSTWYMPTGERCSHCTEGFMVIKKDGDLPVCSNRSCPSNKKTVQEKK